MIFVHSVFYLISDYGTVLNKSHFTYPIILNFLFLSWFIFSIPITAGCSLRMYYQSHLKKNRLINFSLKNIIFVGLFLAISGFIMNFLAFGFEFIFAWNVLQFIFLSFIVITILLKLFSVYVLYSVGILSLFITEPLTSILLNKNPNYLLSILIGNPSNLFYWPFFPWFSIVVFGFLVADLYVKLKHSSEFNWIFLSTGILLLSISFFRKELVPGFDPNSIWGPSIYQPKIGVVLAVIGFFSLLIVFANFLTRYIKITKYGIVNSYSKGILWIYLIYMILAYHLGRYIRRILPLEDSLINIQNTLNLLVIVYPLFFILLAWVIGRTSIKLLQDKRLRIVLKKVN